MPFFERISWTVAIVGSLRTWPERPFRTMTERQEGVCLSVNTFSAGKSKEIRALQAEDRRESGRRIQAATLSRDGPASAVLRSQ